MGAFGYLTTRREVSSYVHSSAEPVAADDSGFVGGDTVVRYRGGVVGVTILNASRLKKGRE